MGPAGFAILRTGDAHKAVANGGQKVDRDIFRSGQVQFFQDGVDADAEKGEISAEIQTGDIGVTHIQLPKCQNGRHIDFMQGILVTSQTVQACVVAEIQRGQLVVATIQAQQNCIVAEIQTGELITLAIQVLQIAVVADIQLCELGFVAEEVLQIFQVRHIDFAQGIAGAIQGG